MRTLPLAGASLLALSASAATASAASITFGFTGGVQTFTVPAAGLYVITAFGAQGGSGSASPNAGGLGAEALSVFTLIPDVTLTIDVGGMGGSGMAGINPGNGSV